MEENKSKIDYNLYVYIMYIERSLPSGNIKSVIPQCELGHLHTTITCEESKLKESSSADAVHLSV